MKVLEAAQLLHRYYKTPMRPPLSGRPWSKHVQVFLRGRVLIIPGTNDGRADKAYFWGGNHPVGTAETHTVVQGKHGTLWHFGMLRFTEEIWRTTRPEDYDLILGHSLGGAAAEILSWRTGKPAMCFGTPGCIAWTARVSGTEQILNVLRRDDIIQMHRVFRKPLRPSRVLDVSTSQRMSRAGHRMAAYIEALKRPEDFPHIPKTWEG